MIGLKEFRKMNKLTQERLGEYLGIKKSFISEIENGKAKLPAEKYAKLLENPYGWITDSLNKQEDGDASNDAHVNLCKTSDGLSCEIHLLRKENEMLHKQLAELSKTNEKYWDMIVELMKK